MTYRLGDAVQARLVEAAPFAGALRFKIVSDETTEATGRRRARPARADPRARKESRQAKRR